MDKKNAENPAASSPLERFVMPELLSGVGALGITYHSCPWWNRSRGTGAIHISAYWFKLIVYMPWGDLTPFGKGTYTSSYGIFWWPSLNNKPNLYWDHK